MALRKPNAGRGWRCTVSRYYNRSVASDGLTVDTDRGPVDTVAVDRVRRGIRTSITRAESAVINAELDYSIDAELLLAEGLGVSHDSVRKRVDRARKRRAARDPGAVQQPPGAVQQQLAVP